MLPRYEAREQQASRQRTDQRRSKGALHPGGEPVSAFTTWAAILPTSFFIGVQHVLKPSARGRARLLLRQTRQLLPHFGIAATLRADLRVLPGKGLVARV